MVSRSFKTSVLGLAVACLAVSATADTKDAWLTTKAKIALLTADDVSASDVNVDTVDGVVTIHGKVESQAEKDKAVAAVQKLDGVKDVKNLLQVVPESVEQTVKVADDAVKDKVEAALKSDASLEGLKVASVNNGVVLLSGKTDAVDKELKAIEATWDVDGVRQVRSEIKSSEK